MLDTEVTKVRDTLLRPGFRFLQVTLSTGDWFILAGKRLAEFSLAIYVLTKSYSRIYNLPLTKFEM